MNKNIVMYCMAAFTAVATHAQTVDYSVVEVNQERGIGLTKISTDNDYVCMPQVNRSKESIDWLSNKILGASPNGKELAYLSFHGDATNIFIKDIDGSGNSVQRTNRQNVLDFSFSPDGKTICFSEMSSAGNRIFVTDAGKGYVCRQITTNDMDYTPVYAPDMDRIFFTRQETLGLNIWSYDLKDNYLSSITAGMNPCPIPNEPAIICVRPSNDGLNEIWKVNYDTGVEECIVSDNRHSFTTPSISPDGQWILCVGNSEINEGTFTYLNTDIYVCRIDGTGLTQLTYHAADDISPVWSHDGKHIYFISQRGSATATANVWRMNFVLQ